jgi:fructose-1,6-bisphosphatase/inositol monophosphatase family enzyme
MNAVGRDELLPRFGTLTRDQIRDKGADDVVTEADLAAEAALARGLGELLPEAVIIAEESADADPTLLEGLAGHVCAWIVDPLDGTVAFSRGEEPWGILVALVRHGRTEAAWIHVPLSGETATAVRGRGARLAGEPMRLAPRVPGDPLRGALHTRFLPPELHEHVEARRPLVDARETHICAARRYIDLSLGREQFALYGRTLPWDHAAGVLLFREAGGVARRFDGSDHAPADLHGGLLLAPDAESWDGLRRTLLP